MNPIIKNNGVRFGVIVGIIGIVYAFGAYLIDETLFSNWLISIFIMLFGIALFVVASVKSKKQMGGFITFRESFSAFMIAAIVYVAISTAGNMLLFHVIDPELGARVQEMIIEKMIERFENMGMSGDQMDEAIARMEDQDSFSVMGQLKGIFSGIVFFAVFGAIASLIIRKNKPEWDTIDNTDETE